MGNRSELTQMGWSLSILWINYSLQQEHSHVVFPTNKNNLFSYQLLLLGSHIAIKIHNGLFVLYW